MITELAQLVDMKNPGAVLKEVKSIFCRCYGENEFSPVEKAFEDFIKLFKGDYPGYRACNTSYHDITHTTDALLAFSRMMDGYNISENIIPAKKAVTGLIAVILHDSGYIQKKDDTSGTGAKYTIEHIKRSISFMKEYFRENSLGEESFFSASNMVECTGLQADVNRENFRDEQDRVLGFMLGTGDLIGQMSSRTYLERLLFLYREFKEGSVPGYESEFDLMEKTIDLYRDTVTRRLERDFEGVYKFARSHFKVRHGIDKNLYIQAIENNIRYLESVLKDPSDYDKKLRRKD
jgi:hypothetical protein